jgi:hypothetical protein
MCRKLIREARMEHKRAGRYVFLRGKNCSDLLYKEAPSGAAGFIAKRGLKASPPPIIWK